MLAVADEHPSGRGDAVVGRRPREISNVQLARRAAPVVGTASESDVVLPATPTSQLWCWMTQSKNTAEEPTVDDRRAVLRRRVGKVTVPDAASPVDAECRTPGRTG